MAAAHTSTISRRVRAARRKAREVATVAHALASTDHVVMAQIVPMRFCNLSCAYCNEYDKVSEPVPVDEMLRRIDHLARLGTSIITISGGEPLTHPDLDRQRAARRDLQEEPQGPRQEAGIPLAIRRLPRQHQLRRRRRHQESAG